LQRLLTQRRAAVAEFSGAGDAQVRPEARDGRLQRFVHQRGARRLFIVDDLQGRRVALHGIERHFYAKRREQIRAIEGQCGQKRSVDG